MLGQLELNMGTNLGTEADSYLLKIIELDVPDRHGDVRYYIIRKPYTT